MTIDEAINDKDRPLSMTPQEWMQYVEATEEEDKALIDNEVARLVAKEGDDESREIDNAEKLDIGIEQMVLGCKIAMRALQGLSRDNMGVREREAYDRIGDLIYNAIGPYLSDVLETRTKLIRSLIDAR